MNFRINSFGYGENHDEDLLSAISNSKNGSFYYIKKYDYIVDCFIESLGYLKSIFGRDATIEIKLFNQIKFKDNFGNNWEDVQDDKARLNLNNIVSGFEKNYLSLINIPKKISD